MERTHIPGKLVVTSIEKSWAEKVIAENVLMLLNDCSAAFIFSRAGQKKVDISRTSLFRHEKLDKILGFLHITELTFIAGSGNPEIKIT